MPSSALLPKLSARDKAIASIIRPIVGYQYGKGGSIRPEWHAADAIIRPHTQGLTGSQIRERSRDLTCLLSERGIVVKPVAQVVSPLAVKTKTSWVLISPIGGNLNAWALRLRSQGTLLTGVSTLSSADIVARLRCMYGRVAILGEHQASVGIRKDVRRALRAAVNHYWTKQVHVAELVLVTDASFDDEQWAGVWEASNGMVGTVSGRVGVECATNSDAERLVLDAALRTLHGAHPATPILALTDSHDALTALELKYENVTIGWIAGHEAGSPNKKVDQVSWKLRHISHCR